MVVLSESSWCDSSLCINNWIFPLRSILAGNIRGNMDNWWALVVVCVVNYVLTSISLLISVRTASKRQILAYGGDPEAAKRIILPCFKPLFQGLIVFYALQAVALCLTFTDPSINSRYFHILQYFNFLSIGVYVITPVLLIQSSVSMPAFWNTFYTVFPWWMVCNVLWGLSYIQGDGGFALDIVFVLCVTVPPVLLSVLILTKLIKSRVQLGSVSNRNSIEFLLAYSLSFGVLYLVALLSENQSNVSKMTLSAIITAISFFCNQIFPFALYRTLLADTKFWRGLGRHNKMGINVHDDLRESGVSVFRPTMDLSVISSTFQDMMAGIGDISVDFAYLQLERIIGHGATSEVYCGRYKKKLVAIKLSNPPEVTEEAIDVFVAEAKIASSLDHPNIVKFVGICVRPPQIAMVFEFCEGGNLKSNLKKNVAKWTPIRRLNACVDTCRAIEAFHQQGLIHRDLKAENFFVGRKQQVKLGDFGESTQARTYESTATRRMTILGTVAFMAPELIAAKRHYTEAIDIYALSITMWEIWTGRDPYEDISQFDIYAKVAEGYRPPLPADAPPGFNEVLQECWQEDANLRPSAADLLVKMEDVYTRFLGGADHTHDDSDGEGEKEKSPANGPNGKTKNKNDKGGPQAAVEEEGDTGDIESGPSVVQVNPILAKAASKRLASGDNNTSSRPMSGASNASDIELSNMSTASRTDSNMSSGSQS